MDLAKLAEAIAPLIRSEIQKATEPLLQEIEALKGREVSDPPSISDVVSSLLVSDELRTLCDLQANEAVAVHLAENPPKDGESPDAEVLADKLANTFERRFAELSLSWDRQARDMAQKAIEAMPKPKDGEDGKDGLSLEDFSVEFDGERTVKLKLAAQDLVREACLRFPVPLYCGVYADGKSYERGDTVTWGGSTWTALKDAPEGKPGTNEDWRLSVKRGQKGEKGDVVTLPATVKVGK